MKISKIRYQNRAWFLVLPAGVILFLVGFIPLMTTFNYSLQDSFAGDQYFWVGLLWYKQMLGAPEFWGALIRTLAFSTITLMLQFAIGIGVARKLYHTQRRPELFIVLFSLPLLTPWIVVGFLWKRLMEPDVGLFGSALSMLALPPDLNMISWSWLTIVAMDVWHWTGLIIILCYAGYLSIPLAYFQAAQIDGASQWNTFRFVEVPRLRNVLIIAGLLRLADSLMVYTEPFMITRGGPDVSTTFLSQELIQTATVEFNLGEAGAISIAYLLVVLPVSWALFRVMEGKR